MRETGNDSGLNFEELEQITDVASHIKSLEIKSQLFALALEQTPEGIEICDDKGNILYLNKRFSQITGITREERIGKNIYDVNPDGVLVQVLERKKPILNAVTSGKRGHDLANAYPIFYQDKFKGAIIISKDYSQAFQLSKRLNEREMYLKEIYRRTFQFTFSNIITNNKKLKGIIDILRVIATTDDPVLLIGEVGTGKSLFAEAIHSASNRNNKPYFKIDCADLADDRVEYELFGYEKNFFPEAYTTKVGLLELADGGTIYLENIQELSIPTQSKLIQSVTSGKTYKYGSNIPISISTRVIASFERPIKYYYYNGGISEDLYNYLENHSVNLPPLCERKEDIPDLVYFFISKIRNRTGKKIIGIRPDVLEILQEYDWPGNVKELKMIMEMIILTVETEVITSEHVISKLPVDFSEKIKSRIMSLEEIERITILKTLNYFENSLNGKKKAAEALQISLGTLYNKMKKYNIK